VRIRPGIFRTVLDAEVPSGGPTHNFIRLQLSPSKRPIPPIWARDRSLEYDPLLENNYSQALSRGLKSSANSAGDFSHQKDSEICARFAIATEMKRERTRSINDFSFNVRLVWKYPRAG